MFAVQGWNVKSSLLKTQSLQPSEPAPGTTAPGENGANTTAGKSTKKRKRSSGKSKASDVNSTNLADLWETVIEGKEKPKELKAPKEKHGEKRQRIERDEKTDGSEAVVVAPGAEAAEGAISKDERPKKGKTLKEKKKEKKAALLESKDTSEGQKVTPETIKAPIPAKPVAKLTPLQASMRQKLISARFRHLNQTLYTTPSAHSLQLFKENPEMFQEYHEGFRRQVEVWPENPVDGYALQIRQRGKLRRDKRGMGKEEKEEMKGSELSPLPRTDGKCHIADLGCGDAKLSEGLQKDLKKLNLAIYSYDLQNPSPLVTKADIANLPLADGSVDIAIFCLALMGTNWVDFIEEAFRILRWKGELWVAEIKSRFGRVSNQSKRVEHSVGNRQRKPDKKTLKKMEEDADDADLMVEVDGNEDKTGETDVSAFVEVLRKRGFVLQNEKAVDLSNRMFVKMHFVKGLTPIKGKGVPVPKGMAEMGLETWKKKPKAKFIDEEEVQVSSEASVLKPCVYKLR